jgi:hypothetical protein
MCQISNWTCTYAARSLDKLFYHKEICSRRQTVNALESLFKPTFFVKNQQKLYRYPPPPPRI